MKQIQASKALTSRLPTFNFVGASYVTLYFKQKKKWRKTGNYELNIFLLLFFFRHTLLGLSFLQDSYKSPPHLLISIMCSFSACISGHVCKHILFHNRLLFVMCLFTLWNGHLSLSLPSSVCVRVCVCECVCVREREREREWSNMNNGDSFLHSWKNLQLDMPPYKAWLVRNLRQMSNFFFHFRTFFAKQHAYMMFPSISRKEEQG